MIEEVINELIIQMENRGYEFESDDIRGIIFQDLQNSLCSMTFNDWDEVKHYVAVHECI